METKSKAEIFKALAEPFDPKEVRYRDKGGRKLAYITSRLVYNRLDEVLGPDNWSEEFEILSQEQREKYATSVVRCTLRIRVGGEWITRIDVGGCLNPDPLVALKGGMSDSVKRAAVKFGPGRHLYGDGIPEYELPEHEEGSVPAEAPTKPSAPKPAPQQKTPAKPAPKTTSKAGDKDIADPSVGRANPLASNERPPKDREAAMANWIAEKEPSRQWEFAQSICWKAGQEDLAPHLRGEEIQLEECVRWCALLCEFWPTWFSRTAATVRREVLAERG